MKSIGIVLVLFILAGCRPKQAEVLLTPDDGKVYVYYFNTESKCPSCVSVGTLAERIVEEKFGGNDSVQFVWINTTLKENKLIIEKYKIHINGIIVARGEDAVNLNREVFSTVVHNPQVASDRIEKEIRKRLDNARSY